MPDGKFFFIRSNLTDMVLTVKDNLVGEGCEVSPWPSHGGDNQLWYEDRVNGCIRLKADDNLVLESTDDGLVLNPYEPEEYHQRWRLAGDHMQHIDDDGKCLDILDFCEDEGAKVCPFEFGGGDNQLFTFQYIPVTRFYIKNAMNGKVIDIRKGDTSAGAKVTMYDCNDAESPNQVFYEDKYGNIKSSMNDFVFDSSEDGKIRMFPYEPDLPCRNWIKNGKKISNKSDPSLVLEIRGGDGGNGAKVNEGTYGGAEHQHWMYAYL